NLLGNRIVLIAPKDSGISVNLQPGVDLAALLKGGRLAMGNVDAVPAGKYGKAALEKLAAWDGVKDKIAEAESVRAALLLGSGAGPQCSLCPQRDPPPVPPLRTAATSPKNPAPPIIYPIALTKDTRNPDAAAFLSYLRSATARPAFERQGFTVLAPGGQRS